MCPLRFSRCPNHDIRFDCWNVKIFDDNKRGYVISYLLCFNLQQITIFYKFYGDSNLHTFRSPTNNRAAFAAFRKLLKTPFARIYLVTAHNLHNLRIVPKHNE